MTILEAYLVARTESLLLTEQTNSFSARHALAERPAGLIERVLAALRIARR